LIDSVIYDIQDPELAAKGEALSRGSLLTKNKIYSNTLIGEERSRLTKEVRNQGYYKFSADNISFELDTINKAYFRNLGNPFESAIDFITLAGNNKKPGLNVKVIIHPGDDSLAFRKYIFNKVVVFPDYNTDTSDLSQGPLVTKTINDIEFRYHKPYVSRNILEKKIFIRPGRYYSQDDYNQTLRQLNDLGVFQNVRLFIFEDRKDSLQHGLNCFILMSPSDKFYFQTNLEVSGGDLYTIGSAATVSVTDKNFFKGANQLTTSISFGLELDNNKNPDKPYLNRFYLLSQNLGVNFRLNFPKFILPVNQNKFSQRSLPHTFLDAGINSLRRNEYFRLRSLNAGFGYLWRETETKSWTVKPVFVNVLSLSDIAPGFQAQMDTIPAIKNSYQETFIEGESGEFVWNTEGKKQWQHAYVKLGLEEAGGLISGIKGLADAVGAPLDFQHAQYLRFDFDGRQYFLQRNSSVVFRFYGGIGIPYGQATILPYLKQYFVGGAYSIRGWRPRILGPGSYYDSTKQNTSDNLFIDQAGDIKLEWNGEYRFGMLKLFSGAVNLNGAIFADAGNIWLARKSPELPGAEFNLGRLYQDLALSSGAGLRLDFGGFLVVRLDWAFPLKKPYVSDHYGWVIRDIDFGDPEWRKKNINLNVAIGYPF
jgi:outer membrane protein assembly factor BamA